MDKESIDYINEAYNETPQKNSLERVNETFERISQDVKQMIHDNNEASKIE